MKRLDQEMMDSEYVTIDERGWHIADNAPDELKERFERFLEEAQDGMEIELK